MACWPALSACAPSQATRDLRERPSEESRDEQRSTATLWGGVPRRPDYLRRERGRRPRRASEGLRQQQHAVLAHPSPAGGRSLDQAVVHRSGVRQFAYRKAQLAPSRIENEGVRVRDSELRAHEPGESKRSAGTLLRELMARYSGLRCSLANDIDFHGLEHRPRLLECDLGRHRAGPRTVVEYRYGGCLLDDRHPLRQSAVRRAGPLVGHREALAMMLGTLRFVERHHRIILQRNATVARYVGRAFDAPRARSAAVFIDKGPISAARRCTGARAA